MKVEFRPDVQFELISTLAEAQVEATKIILRNKL